MCLHGRHELILVVYLEFLRVAVEDGDDHARPKHLHLGRLASTRGQHQAQVLRVGARESQIVRAVDRNRGVERRQPLEAIIATTVLCPLMVPTTAKQVDIASRGKRDGRQVARGVIFVHALDDKPRGLHGGGVAQPRIPLSIELAAMTIRAIATVGNLTVCLSDRTARGVVDGRGGLTRRASLTGVENALIACKENHAVAPVRIGGR